MSSKVISQPAFDEMVQENIDALGLEPQEALEAAIEELKLQGVDTSCVVKSIPGTTLNDHPIAMWTKALRENASDRLKHLLELEKALKEKRDSENHVPIALKEGTVDWLVNNLNEETDSKEAETMGRVLWMLLRSSPLVRSRFLQIDGPNKFISTTQNILQSTDLEKPIKLSIAINVIVGACYKCEPAKCKSESKRPFCVKFESRFMEPSFVESLSNLLKEIEISMPHPASRYLMMFFMALTNPDDPETSASQTFMHSRILAQQKVHLSIVRILENALEPQKKDKEIVLSAMNALRCLAANDEICKEICEAGGIVLFMENFDRNLRVESLVKPACITMRQLACSDTVKVEIMKHDGARIFSHLLSMYSNDGEIFENLVGIMTLITLRQPRFARAFCDVRCHEELKQAFMSSQKNNPKVLRQCCSCIRNFVVRDEDIKNLMLQIGMEPLIRDCKDRFPKECRDEASSALRDLGFDDYL